MTDFHFDIFPVSTTKTKKKVSSKEKVTPSKSIILFNDEVNTFDFVIESLIEICGHDPIQAEQCSIIVHYKGKCDVMKGGYYDLKPPCEQLLRRGLSAEIQ